MNRFLNFASVVFSILGTVLLSCMDNSHWAAGCFSLALFCITLSTGRLR